MRDAGGGDRRDKTPWDHKPGEPPPLPPNPAIKSRSLIQIEMAAIGLVRLRLAVRQSQAPTDDEIHAHLYPAVGWIRAMWDEGPAGEFGRALERLKYAEDEAERTAARDEADWVLDSLQDHLQQRREAWVAHETSRAELVRAASPWPASETAMGFLKLRPQVARELEDARRALREAVGRRRLGELARAWLRGA